MNLIYEPWIPVRRADGGPPQRIAPWQLTEDIQDNPILAVASPRPDFDGALTQFLIGLLQTTCTPNSTTWLKWRKEPPTPEQLKQRFSSVAHAFELEGATAFMQDYLPLELKEEWPIERLLIGAPGKSTIEKGTDHFCKAGTYNVLCPSCAASALYTWQINGMAFGSGYREGLRGGGPITTLVVGNANRENISLWELSWTNVLEKAKYVDGAISDNNSDKDRFPWMGQSRVSDSGQKTFRDDVNLDQQYWPMQQRIRLIKSIDHQVTCDLCGEVSSNFYRNIRIKNHGVWYEGFEHPLSPHVESRKGSKAMRMPKDSIGYRHWMGLLLGESIGENKLIPARVVQQFRHRQHQDGRIWAFGVNITPGQANALCWYDSTMPLLNIKPEYLSLFEERIASLVKSARFVGGQVMTAVIRATLLEVSNKENRGTDIHVVWKWPREILNRLKTSPSERAKAVQNKVNDSGEELDRRILSDYLSAPMSARSEFWAVTDRCFFERANEMRSIIVEKGNPDDIAEKWRKDICRSATTIFMEYGRTQNFDIDPRRIVLAEYELNKSLNGSLLRKILLLP